MVSPVVITRMQNRRGIQSQFDALYPGGYDGVGGFGSIGGYNITNYPSVLLSGEVALCTDTRRIFIGNINGEFFEISTVEETTFDNLVLQPAVVSLAPQASFTVMATYNVTPFKKIFYDVANSASVDPNVVGATFSRNGIIDITAVTNFTPASPVAPFPAITPVTLTDSGVEINTVSPKAISFMAQYTDISALTIDILYKHDFTGSLTFSSSSVVWLPL